MGYGSINGVGTKMIALRSLVASFFFSGVFWLLLVVAGAAPLSPRASHGHSKAEITQQDNTTALR